MRTSLIELSLIERKLNDERSEDPLPYLAGIEIEKKIRWQMKAYKLIRLLARKDLKTDLSQIHKRLMKQPEFRERVQDIFPQT